MAGIGRLFKSSIGRKLIMALTGIALFGFLIGHVSGNLLIFKGQEAINDYAEWLVNLGPLLWVARAGLLAIFALHIYMGIQLSAENRAARPEPYAHEATVQASLPSRWMLTTGLLVLAYVVYHLAHFTFGVVLPDGAALVEEPSGRHDVYGMIVYGFQNPIVSISYLVFLAILGVHLWHGVASFFQTVGLSHARYARAAHALGRVATLAIILAYVLIPVSVMLGFVGRAAS